MSFLASEILLIITITVNILMADANGAYCEIKPNGQLFCYNVRKNSPDYIKSIQIMIPKFLQRAKENKEVFSFVLADSDLKDIPDDLLQGFNISGIGFALDTFDSFPPNFLMRVSSDVKVLYMKFNEIHLLDFHYERFLKELPFAGTLIMLTLQQCNITFLMPYAFRRFTSLEDLDLSNNLILSVGSREFANHPTLKTIDLSHNKIAFLEEEAFAGLPNLRYLDLSSNMILGLQDRPFVELEHLRRLNLANNLIFKIEENTFNDNDLPKLYDLQLEGNKLICDCDLQWFKNWLFERDMLDDSDATCANLNRAPLANSDICSHKG